MGAYLLFWPGRPGVIWANISADGKTENVVAHNIIEAMKRGVYTQKGYDILCVPNPKNRYGSLTARKCDCVKLGHLFAPKKNRGSNTGLKAIAAINRFKGKVNWEQERHRIGELIGRGKSVSEVARMLGVLPSTLSKANKRHHLYPPKQSPCK